MAQVPYSEAFAAPLCEVGAVAYATSRVGLDLREEVLAAEWAAATSRRRLTTLSQPFIDRSDVAFSSQGRGWREVGERLHGVRCRDLRVSREHYLEVAEEATPNGVVVVLDDFHVPWLDYSGRSHGLLPHACAIQAMVAERSLVALVEGHTWWAGTYECSYPDLLQAAFPADDPHEIAGWQVHVDSRALHDVGTRRRSACDGLVQSCNRYLQGGVETAVTPHGTTVTTEGAASFSALRAALGSFSYVCELAATGPGIPESLLRDREFGRYTFLRVTDELAFGQYCRAASAQLIERASDRFPADVHRRVDAVASRTWVDAWRAARSLTASLERGQLRRLLDSLALLEEEDAAAAASIAVR